MQKHIRNFIKHYNLTEGEVFMCQYCNNAPAVDIHHIRGRLGTNADDVKNLIGLCRQCHMQAHKQAEPYLTIDELLNKKES